MNQAPMFEPLCSKAETIASLPPEARAAWLKKLSAPALKAIEYDWKFWRRPEQAAPEGAWHQWMVMAGRGFGKTRAGAEWVRGHAEAD